MNNLQLAWTVLANPQAAFARLRERPAFVFPALLMVVSSVAMLVWYYSIVDTQWLMDRILSASSRTAQMSDAQKAQIGGRVTGIFLMASSVIGVVISVAVAYALSTTYYLLAGKVTNVERPFMQWLSIATWSSLPGVFGILAGLVVLAVNANPHLPQTDLQVLSLNELFFHREMGQPGSSLLSTLSILQPWSWVLSVIGVRGLSQRSWAYSIGIVAVPIIVVYGCWALLSFR